MDETNVEVKGGMLKRLAKFTKIAEIIFGWQLRNIEAELTETQKKLETINTSKESWDKEQSTAEEKFNEDQISILRINVKKDQSTIACLKATLRLQIKKEKREEIIEQIQFLETQTKENVEKLVKLNTKFRDYLKVSGMKISELEAKKEELEIQLSGARLVYAGWIWLILTVLSVAAIMGITISIGLWFYLASWEISIFSGISAVIPLIAIIMGGIILAGYHPVPEKQEWTIELFGKFVMIWRTGFHIKLPFFMTVSGKVYMGDVTLPLNLGGERNAEGKQTSMVEFLDSSAGVIVNVFYRIFSAYRAIYNIDNLGSATGKKMEAGIRAYYGNQTIDEAIAGRAEVDLRKIITQNATEAEIFKTWGATIISLAVTDFTLPDKVEESRQTKLIADKEKEVAEIKQQKAIIDAETAKIQGTLEGNRLKQLATTIEQPIDKTMEYDLMVKRLNAYEKSGMLIVGDQGDAKSAGAIAGAAAQLGAKTAQRT